MNQNRIVCFRLDQKINHRIACTSAAHLSALASGLCRGQFLTPLTGNSTRGSLASTITVFWGFDTAEGWDEFQNEIAKGHNDDFYIDLIRYARGEPNGLTPGTIGFKKAKIAKALIEGDSSFAEPEAREALFEALNAVYEKTGAAGAVVLTTGDRALAELLMARADDLPQA